MGIEKFASEIARAADRKATGNGPVLGLESFALSCGQCFRFPHWVFCNPLAAIEFERGNCFTGCAVRKSEARRIFEIFSGCPASCGKMQRAT
jgi:hypothetical protein